EVPGSGIGAEIQAMRQLGIRHAVGYVMMDLSWESTLPLDEGAVQRLRAAASDVSRRETAQAFDGASAFIEQYHGSHPLTTCLLGPSAAHRCTDELLQETRRLADATGVGIHMHLAE